MLSSRRGGLRDTVQVWPADSQKSEGVLSHPASNIRMARIGSVNAQNGGPESLKEEKKAMCGTHFTNIYVRKMKRFLTFQEV